MPLTNGRKINGYLEFNLFNGWNRPLTEQLEKFGTCPALQVETFAFNWIEKFIQKALQFFKRNLHFVFGFSCTLHGAQTHILAWFRIWSWCNRIQKLDKVGSVFNIETPGTELLCFIRRRLTNFKGTVRKKS